MYTNIIMTFLPRAYPLFFFLTVHNCDVFRYSQGSLCNGERKSVTQFDGTFTLAEKKTRSMVREYAELLHGGKPAAKNPPDFGGTLNFLQILLVVCKTTARWQAWKGEEKDLPTAGIVAD
jgi:hypothetical protein